MVKLMDLLLDSLQLLHFHIGSQLTAIQALKEALREGTKRFISLVKMGAPLRYFDAGGGLAVDHVGSQSAFHSSRDHDEQEYANDLISITMDTCDEAGIAHPGHLPGGRLPGDPR